MNRVQVHAYSKYTKLKTCLPNGKIRRVCMNIHWERTTKADCFGRVLCFVVCMAQSTQYLHLLV